MLVIFPHEPRVRTRPGARRPGPAGWGDYHPCSAEFFLARAHQRDQPPPYDLRHLARKWRPLPRTGLAALERMLASVSPEQAARWELDLAEVPSQDEQRAWQVYADLLEETSDPFRCVVYGRHYADGQRRVLQYWYLYLYNDFRNNHEADWEMAAIELSPEGEPVRMGLSSHAGGAQRAWSQVQRIGERPVVYVALGSHANYFAYNPRGIPVLDLRFRSDAPRALRPLSWLLQHLPMLDRWRDQPPADPQRDRGARREHLGVRMSPALEVLPHDMDHPDDTQWWWLRYRGTWGSSGARVAGTTGVDTPWGRGGQDPRWRDPVAWLDRCRSLGRRR